MREGSERRRSDISFSVVRDFKRAQKNERERERERGWIENEREEGGNGVSAGVKFRRCPIFSSSSLGIWVTRYLEREKERGTGGGGRGRLSSKFRPSFPSVRARSRVSARAKMEKPRVAYCQVKKVPSLLPSEAYDWSGDTWRVFREVIDSRITPP